MRRMLHWGSMVGGDRHGPNNIHLHRVSEDLTHADTRVYYILFKPAHIFNRLHIRIWKVRKDTTDKIYQTIRTLGSTVIIVDVSSMCTAVPVDFTYVYSTEVVYRISFYVASSSRDSTTAILIPYVTCGTVQILPHYLNLSYTQNAETSVTVDIISYA